MTQFGPMVAGHNRKRLGRVGWILLTVLLAAASGCDDLGRRYVSDAEGTDAFGTFQRFQGIGVLTVWGDPYQCGRAHGRLVPQGVLDLVDTLCGSNLLIHRGGDYQRVVLPMMDRFVFSQPDEEELRGILDGVTEKLGDKAILPRIGRRLTLADLKAANTAGDWYRQGCTSFAAWGGLTQEGHVWIGHNFDFMPARAFFSHQLIMVHRPLGNKKAWATVSAPGMIGCIAGINAEGVFATTHDVFLPLRPVVQGYVPRLLALRRLLETCSPRDLQAQALPILESSPQMFDNAILLAAPTNDGTPPALVFECGTDRQVDKGVTVRLPQNNESALGGEAIVCTNHFRKRAGPRTDAAYYRYPLMQTVLAAKTARQEKIDFTIARKAMGAVRLPITVNTVVADLNTLDFWFAPGEFLSPPGAGDFVKLPVGKLIAGE